MKAYQPTLLEIEMNTQRKAIIKKLVVDGKVAVLVASGPRGGAWSTCNPDAYRNVLCFDGDIAQAVLAGELQKAAELATEKCKGLNPIDPFHRVFVDDLQGLEVVWVEKGKQFEIVEFNGRETLNVISEQVYMRA